jgi:hypothetical protein
MSMRGVEEFTRYVDAKLMAKRVQSNHFVLLAEANKKMIGTIEMGNFNHISLFLSHVKNSTRALGGNCCGRLSLLQGNMSQT